MRIDPKLQKRVWQRVQASKPPVQPQPGKALQMCRRRASESLRFYESRGRDPIYGPAYDRLAELTRQELAMLDRILG